MGYLFNIKYFYETVPGVPIEVTRKIEIDPGILTEKNVMPSFIVPGTLLTIPQPANTFTYIVKEGDNLNNIANKFNVSVNEIMELNDMKDFSLSIGDILLIPTKVTEESLTNEVTYEVQPGDNLGAIAMKFNTTVEQIKKRNNLKTDKLDIGRLLIIDKPPAKSFTYTVKPGDTLGEIAIKFNSSLNEIRKINNLPDDRLFIGQKLEIPLINLAGDTKVPSNFTEYLVQEGDTIEDIAKAFKTTGELIVTINNLVPYIEILPQIISELEKGFIEYKIEKGDSLSVISNKTKVPISEIIEENPGLTEKTPLDVGQIIKIPVIVP